MDPYHILRVERGCTREEVKEAFRAKVWHAHPDRGGEELAFIQLCAAYKLILKDVGRRPSPGTSKPARPDRQRRPPNQRGSTEEGRREPSPQPARGDRFPRPPDARWKPDLVLLDDSPRDRRPPKPPDPNWTPDLVLLHEAPVPGDSEPPPDLRGPEEPYRSWLRRVSVRSNRGIPFWRSAWFRAIGVILFLGLVAANLWFCWVAWNYDPEEEARRTDRILKDSNQSAASSVRSDN